MTSSREAFDKFSKWKNSQTVLKLTETTPDGVSKSVSGEIYHVDFGRLMIGFSVSATREHFGVDLSGASFSVEPHLVEAKASSLGRLLFEELLTQ